METLQESSSVAEDLQKAEAVVPKDTRPPKLRRNKKTQKAREAYAKKRLLEGALHDDIRTECQDKWGTGIGSSYLTKMAKKLGLSKGSRKPRKQMELPFTKKEAPTAPAIISNNEVLRADSVPFITEIAQRGLTYRRRLPDGSIVEISRS